MHDMNISNGSNLSEIDNETQWLMLALPDMIGLYISIVGL